MAGLIEKQLKMPSAAKPGDVTIQPSAAPGATTAPGTPVAPGQPLPVSSGNVTSQTVPMSPGTAPIQGQQVTGEGYAQPAEDNVVRKNIEGLPTFATYDADQREVNADTDLVENRTAGIIDKNSMLMQRAAAQAREYANTRGLISSSMAAGAAQGAVMDRAAQIAAQDAQAYRDARLANQNASNEARQFGATAENNFRGMQYDDQLQRGRLTMQQEFDLGKDEARFAHEREMQTSEQGFKAGESAKDREWTSLEKGLDRALTKEESALERGLKRELTMADITSREKISDNQIKAAADNLAAELGSRERMQASDIAAAKDRLGMELQSRSDLSAAEIEAAKDRLGMELESRATLQANDQEFARESQDKAIAAEFDKMKLGQEFDLQKIQDAQKFEIERMDQALQNEIKLASEQSALKLDELEKAGEIDLQQKERLMALDNQYQIEKAKVLNDLDLDTKKQLMDIEAGYNLKLRGSDQAATFMQQHMADIGALMRDPNIKKEDKLDMANTMIETLNKQMNNLGKIHGVDVSDLFPVAPGAAPGAAPGDPADPAAPAPNPAQPGMVDKWWEGAGGGYGEDGGFMGGGGDSAGDAFGGGYNI